MKIAQIIEMLEDYAPLSLQESFDNAGLQIGDVRQTVRGMLLCLDVTEEIVDEAIELDCNLIISHHPLIFKPLKSLSGKNYIERCIIKACKNDIAVYSAHTNLDNVLGGVNSQLADKIGLLNTRILKPMENRLLKLVTFVPVGHADAVRNALFRAGAGCIGNYDSCSYNVEGEGTFCAGEDAHPFVGERGELHFEKETRIETILPAHRKNAILKALLVAHPYEEPAYDFYPLANDFSRAGSGIIGELPTEEDEETFLQRLKNVFRVPTLKHSPLTGRPVRRIAVCGGSGAFLIPDAIAAGADVFVTGEARYNDYYDVEDHLLLSVLGHYETEQCTKEIFFDIITKKIPNFAPHFSNVNTNPVNYM